MSSWFAFGQIGIFLVAGQDLYLIGRPTFPLITFYLAGDKDFTIKATNISAENKYVIAADLKGSRSTASGFAIARSPPEADWC